MKERAGVKKEKNSSNDSQKLTKQHLMETLHTLRISLLGRSFKNKPTKISD